MATGILFATGFDWVPDGTNTRPHGWTGGTFRGVGAAYARGVGGKGGYVQDTWNAFVNRPYLSLPASYDHIVLQLAVRTNGAFPTVNFLTNSTTSIQLTIGLNANKQLSVARGATVLGTTSFQLSSNSAWYYLELRVKFDGAAGEVEILCNGEQILDLSGVDTENQATADCSGFAFYADGTNPGWYVDDIVFRDYSVVSSMVGDLTVMALMPDGTGDSADFTPSAAVDNYTLVDEIPTDSDTTYVESSTVGHQDTYAVTDHGIVTGTMFGLQVHHHARKTDGATRQIAAVVRHSGSETVGATVTLGSSYSYATTLFDDVPGGTGWTLAQLDAITVGQKVIA